MRHPLLRILVALLIGVISPLCCCQAAALVGGGCGGGHEIAAKVESCCGGCSGKAESGEEQTPAPLPTDAPSDVPSDDHHGPPGKCPSCPTCQGTSAGAGAKAEATLPAFEPQWNALATISLAVLWDLPTLGTTTEAAPPGWAIDPPHLRANRAALRWYCALIV